MINRIKMSGMVVLSAWGCLAFAPARAQTPIFGASALQAGTLVTHRMPSQFYKVGIRHYDAGMMADLITRQEGIVLVPPNFVIPANPSLPGMLAPPTVTSVPAGTAVPAGPAPGPATTTLPGQTPASVGPAAAPAAANVLPPGIKRIFVLESDNSLVFEADPESLAGTPLNKGNTP